MYNLLRGNIFMAASGLNQKYTVEKYCTKAELAKALGTNLIEPFWREIIEFRRKFAIELPLYDASYSKFYLAFIESIQAKNLETNNLITKFVGGTTKLTKGSIAHYTFTRDMLKASLRAVAKLNKIDVSEITLTNIIERKEVDYQYFVLVRYFEALEDLKASSFGTIDDSFLAKNYAILRGEEELTCFYRESDNVTASSKVLIDKSYDQGIPAHLIDDSMQTLIEYINNQSVSLVSRISAIYFMFNYVKPFEIYNLELASLLAKRVLSSTSIDTSSIYVPLEIFLNDKEFFGEISKEVNRTHDFTYAFLRASDLINMSLNVAIDRIVEVHSTYLDNEVKMGTDEKKIRKEFGFKVENPHVEVKKVETKAQIQARIEANAPVDTTQLSEKEIKAKIKALLEADPFLKKGMADFYVRHCALGKYYTLQQYMKAERVVYETARTAMVLLAERGYYRQEKIKNKFVYTPINKE